MEAASGAPFVPATTRLLELTVDDLDTMAGAARAGDCVEVNEVVGFP